MKILSSEKVPKKCKYFVILHYIRDSLRVKVAEVGLCAVGRTSL
jgi:hypothetical protein